MTLSSDLSRFDAPIQPNPYEAHHLLENPFPGFGETRADVCTDQNEIKEDFVDVLRNFGAGAKRLRINGASGAGKTNILRYFERLTDEARIQGRVDRIYPIYVSDPEDNYFAIHKQIIDKVAEYFLSDLLGILRAELTLRESLKEEIKPAAELLSVLGHIIQQRTFYEMFEERRRDILLNWLKGQKLSIQDKKQLGISIADITSPSLAIRFLDGLLQVLRKLQLCNGVVLLFDEFEEIFEGPSRAMHSRYAQDLRHILDTLEDSVFFVIATVPEPKDLEQYPAVIRRLGTARLLRPINTPKLALEYVRNYMAEGRRQYDRLKGENADGQDLDNLAPLTEELVVEHYGLIRTEVGKKLEVLPGYFLPKMRELMTELVERRAKGAGD